MRPYPTYLGPYQRTYDGAFQGRIQTSNSTSAKLCCKKLRLISFLNILTLRSLIGVPSPKIFPPRAFLIHLHPHPPLLLNFGKCCSQDIFKSRQQQKTISIFLLKNFVTDYLLFEFPKSLHCSF